MTQHVAKVASVCCYHIRRLRQIRRRVGQEVTTRLVLAMVTTRLDYCNSLLAGLPQSTLEPLQRVQNCAARLILNLRQRDHVTPALKQLHWLPIQARVQFKLYTLMHGIHNSHCPAYLSDAFIRSRLRQQEKDCNRLLPRIMQLQDCGPGLASVRSRTLALLLGINSRKLSARHKHNSTSRDF